MASVSTVDDKCRRSMQDSGVGSFGSESDTSPVQQTQVPSAGTVSRMNAHVPKQTGCECPESEMKDSPNVSKSAFRVSYLGESLLDRRYTQPMLPWILSEVRRRGQNRPLILEILSQTLKGTDILTKEIVFEHQLKSLSRFARPQQDLSVFAYLSRPNAESPFSCHVFKVAEESQVPELFTAIRDATKEAVKDYNSNTTTVRRGSEPLEGLADPNARHFFEVLYVGKVIVSEKKAPPTFIDDAVEKFHIYEIEKYHRESVTDDIPIDRKRHNSAASLPGYLEKNVDVKENELANQVLGINGDGHQVTSSGSEGNLLNSDTTNIRNCDGNQNRSVDTLAREVTQQKNGGSGGLVTENMEAPPRKNRTLLLQVGRSEISLISPDKKKVMLERKFKDISFCSQGVKQAEHFGFISREPKSGNFLCYVFKCASETVVEEVMGSLKQAFHVAFQQNAKKNIVCELCPMHQLHKLCHEIEGLDPSRTFEILQARVDQLPDKEREETWAKFREEELRDYQTMNEMLMGHLRHICELRQVDHIHISDKNQASKAEFYILGSKPSKFDDLKNKAKKSLTSSFENFLKGMKKEDAQKQRQRSQSGDSKPSRRKSTDSIQSVTPNSSPVLSPVAKDSPGVFPSPDSGKNLRRARSSTVGDSMDMDRFRKEVEDRTSQERELRRAESGDDRSDTFETPTGPMYEELGPKRTKSPSPKGVDDLTPHPTPQPKPHLRRQRKISFRRSILDRVATPVHRQESVTIPETECLGGDSIVPSSAGRGGKHTSQHLRGLWKKAILETLLLIRMERENNSLQDLELYDDFPVASDMTARQDAAEIKRIKLDYEEITPCLKEVTKVWDQMIVSSAMDNKIKFSHEIVAGAVRSGVPRHKRSEIWQLLVEQHQLQHPELQKNSEDPGTTYDNLLKQLTTHQHAILIDLGRTFPTHPYFSTQLGPGQLALFNLLKAYSLLDREVGYCQGLSFIAGILLMHMREEKAFATLRYIMFNMGFRDQYRPNMISLQIQMYQLSRLLHDHYKDLYDHFETYDIAPTLYAAPWFLTMFASQFPLGFVARVYDLIFLQGQEVVYKVALMLLGNHKELIMECHSFESIVEFLKTTLPDLGIIQMERVINQVFSMDISRQLDAYEVEYNVLQEELAAVPSKGDTDQLQKLESTNQLLKRQNTELIEQLQSAHSHQHTLESQISRIQQNESKLKSHIKTLELERAALLNTVANLRQLVPQEVLEAANISIPDVAIDRTITSSPIHNPNLHQLLTDDGRRLFSSSGRSTPERTTQQNGGVKEFQVQGQVQWED